MDRKRPIRARLGSAKRNPALEHGPEVGRIGGTCGYFPSTMKPIDVRWRTGVKYSYLAGDRAAGDKRPTLDTHPKGWPPPAGTSQEQRWEQRPDRVESAPRHTEAEPLVEPDPKPTKKPEIAHYLNEFGPSAVQASLANEPKLKRKPSRGEEAVVKDFRKAIDQTLRLSQGKRHPLRGEFLGMYSRSTDIETGATQYDRRVFKFSPGNSVEVPEIHPRPDYVIHSHPFDPKDPAGHAGTELGVNYPSGTDRLRAAEAVRDAGFQAPGGPKPTKEMMMHGNQAFVIHGHDLDYTELDLPAPPKPATKTPAAPGGAPASGNS